MNPLRAEVADSVRRDYATVDTEDATSVAALFALDATYSRPGTDKWWGARQS